MIHHASLPVSDLFASTRLYDAAMGALGYRRVSSSQGFAGYGIEEGKDKLALVEVADTGPTRPGFHIALTAPTRRSVDSFYEAVIAHGGMNNGPPGLRPQYGSGYYAAFVVDLDGNHIEAVCKEAK